MKYGVHILVAMFLRTWYLGSRKKRLVEKKMISDYIRDNDVIEEKTLLKHIEHTLTRFLNDRCRNFSRYHVLLRDQSSTLDNIASMCKNLFPQEIVVCRIKCSEIHESEDPPLKTIANKLGTWVSFRYDYQHDSIDYVEKTLQSKHQKCILLIDDLQILYEKWSYDRFTMFVAHLDCMISSKSGVFFCVLSGNTPHLTNIAYGNFPTLAHGRKFFKNYNGRSLNETKLLHFARPEDLQTS